MANIKLSVIVPTYNHEHYIEECIRSILKQKVNFNFEVLIGEDCSKDKTAEILKYLEKELPSNYKIFYREHNMGMGPSGNAWDLQNKAQGEYIISIEGDDFFIDEHKLQKQVDFLDSHKTFVAVAHNCQVVDKNSKYTTENYPECKDEEYTFDNYLKEELPGQLATIMYRREYNKAGEKFYDGYKLYEFYPGDRLKSFLMLTCGRVRCFQKKWSAYRYVTTTGTSYSATTKRDDRMKKNEVLFYKSIYNYAKTYGDKRAIKTSGKMYFSRLFVRSFGKNREYSFSYYLKEVFKEKQTFLFLWYSVKRTGCLAVKKVKDKMMGV